mgnify:CR=1 FL=1
MEKKDLEIVLDKKVKPLIKDATTKFLGVGIEKLNEDITSTLSRSSFGDIKVDYSSDYKKAKKQYKKDFLSRILVLNLGNISEAAKLLGLDRRTLHRMVKEFNIDVNKIKPELLRPYPIKVSALSGAIEEVLDDLQANNLSPDELLVDTAYASDDNVQLAEEKGIELVGPVAGCSTQNYGQLTTDDFNIDERTEEVVCCPAGHKPQTSEHDTDTGKTKTVMAKSNCNQCEYRPQSPQPVKRLTRTVTSHSQH